MIEREVTDILQVTLSVGLASIYIFSSTDSIETYQINILSLVALSIFGFLHNILTQLRMMNSSKSKYFVYLSLVTLTVSIIALIDKKPEDWGSFWSNLNLTSNFVLFTGYSLLSIAVVLSYNATLAYSSEKTH